MVCWFYNLPLLVTGPAIIGSICLVALLGLFGVRRCLLPRLRIKLEDSEYAGAMVQAVMVFYGLAVALIAVSVWQTYSDVSKIVSQEATALASLYRDLSSYPPAIRSRLQTELREYTEQIIQQAWPQQRQGQIPSGGVEYMDRFQALLLCFEPTTDSQRILHAETVRAYNQLIQARRLRLDSVQTRLPPMLWLVIALGAVISLSSSFFFRVEDGRLHGILVALLASFVGLVIFMIFALDRPFCGELGLDPAPYQLVHDHLMKIH